MEGSRALLSNTIVEALARGATVLTGNQRAARTLRREFDRRNRALGLESWAPPPIAAWDAWTAELWTRLLLDGHATRLLLNRAQEHTLWHRIITADAAWNSLLTVDALAEMAAEAWARLCAYGGERRLRTAGISVDTMAFQRWALAFEERCHAEGYLTQAQLAGTLAAAVRARKVSLAEGGYLLTGFDGWTPAQESLAAAIRAAGAASATIPNGSARGEQLLVTAESERVELACAARWLRARLDTDANRRIALIVPGLEGRRAEIDRALRHALAPELEEITLQATAAPFEFSLGVPLARTALGSAALDLLRWAVEPLPIERVSRLLLSPCLADGAELMARAEFDAYELRRLKLLRPELTLDKMTRLVEGSRRAPRLPKLLGALKAMRRVAAAEGFAEAGLGPHTDWAESLRALLQAAGWAGTGDSVEFQTRRKWEGMLDEFTTLDFTGVRVNALEALAILDRMARQALFAPESRGAPVQVMGPLESAGSEFDAVWFLGAGELEWPVRPQSTPLLSWPLQQDLGMPGADPARDAAYARRMTERIARSGGAVVFSYATEAGEGRQRASAMLAELELLGISARALAPEPEARPPLTLETIDDSTALPSLPDRVMRGGARLLQLQAACGFRAFAELRLSASALDGSEPGMDARARGNAVHTALELFWNQVTSQAELKRLTTDRRREILADAVERALAKTAGPGTSDWETAYLEVQRERLMALLDAWLLAEMGRAVPFTVKRSETELKDVAIGPLRLSLRVDRVDETEFGDVIVDYKTGAASPADWLSDRPGEPQLPLYAVLAQSEPLAGVAFGQVRAGKDMTLHGYETQRGVLLKAAKLQAPTLDEQVEAWRQCLTTLAEDFHRGDVRVRPKMYPHTCEFCEQRLLCRLDLTLLEADALDASDEAGEGDPEGQRG